MLKYVDTKVVFQEIPDEVTLAINISNCPCNCKNCHSSYLSQDIGDDLTITALRTLIEKNKGVSCVAFMGGDYDPSRINTLASFIKNFYSPINVAWYSGRQELSEDIDIGNFDYIKLGPYIEDLGSLISKNTNQRLYKIVNREMIDITSVFWI